MVSGEAGSLAQLHILHIDVDIETEETLVLDLAVLRDHEHVLLCHQVVDAVRDFLRHLGCSLHVCAHALLKHDFLQNVVNDFGLLDRFLTLALEILELQNDHPGDLLILLERDLYFLLNWLSLLLNLAL